jgi:hypothetical protein
MRRYVPTLSVGMYAVRHYGEAEGSSGTEGWQDDGIQVGDDPQDSLASWGRSGSVYGNTGTALINESLKGDSRRVVIARLEMKEPWLGGEYYGEWILPMFPPDDFVRGGRFREQSGEAIKLELTLLAEPPLEGGPITRRLRLHKHLAVELIGDEEKAIGAMTDRNYQKDTGASRAAPPTCPEAWRAKYIITLRRLSRSSAWWARTG